MKKALFVCIGNICRSPIAAGLGNKLYGNSWSFESAGITMSGVKASALAIEVLDDLYDIDIQKHRSRIIYDINITKFDLIIVLDKGVYAKLSKSSYSEKLLLWDVTDPYGKNYDAYEETVKVIEDNFKKYSNYFEN